MAILPPPVCLSILRNICELPIIYVYRFKASYNQWDDELKIIEYFNCSREEEVPQVGHDRWRSSVHHEYQRGLQPQPGREEGADQAQPPGGPWRGADGWNYENKEWKH